MIEVKKNELILIYDSKKQNDKKALGYLQSLDQYVIKSWDISKEPLTETQIASIAAKLKKSPEYLIDQQSDLYKERMKNSTYIQKEELKILKHNPSIIRTPIVITANGADLMKSPFELNSQLVKIDKGHKL